MKISNKPPEAQGPNRSNPKSSRKATKPTFQEKTADAQRTRPAHEVGNTEKEREIADIVATVNHLPDVREHKVRTLKKAVDSGTYIINARNIAESLLRDL